MKWLSDLLEANGIQVNEDLMTAIKAELPKHFKPAEEFNARGAEIEALKEQVAKRDLDLKDLKKNAEKDSELATQLTDLQKKYAEDTKKLSEQMADLKITSAIKLSVATDSQDVDIVSSLIDRSKLVLKDDGTVDGLTEQVEALKSSKGFLFKGSEQTGSNYTPANGSTVGSNQVSQFDFNFNKINNY